jgi:hypothetical protein
MHNNKFRDRMRRVAAIALSGSTLFAGILVGTGTASADSSCQPTVPDSDPRGYRVRTTDSHSGGMTFGDVHVQRRSDRGYNVCVAGFVDDDYPDGKGAAAYATYEYWNGSRWVPVDYALLQRADGYEMSNWYSITYRTVPVRNFYVGVCRIAAGVISNCNDER